MRGIKGGVVKFIIFLMVLFLFMGCNLMLDFYEVPEYDIDPPGLKEGIDSYYKIGGNKRACAFVGRWIYENISNASDKDIHGEVEYWQTPEETYNLMTGDCEDMTILWMYLVHRYLDLSPKLYCVKFNKRGTGHAFAVDNEIYFTTYPLENYTTLKIYSYEEALVLAEYIY